MNLQRLGEHTSETLSISQGSVAVGNGTHIDNTILFSCTGLMCSLSDLMHLESGSTSKLNVTA